VCSSGPSAGPQGHTLQSTLDRRRNPPRSPRGLWSRMAAMVAALPPGLPGRRDSRRASELAWWRSSAATRSRSSSSPASRRWPPHRRAAAGRPAAARRRITGAGCASWGLPDAGPPAHVVGRPGRPVSRWVQSIDR
jgi:hypothetical protein